MTHSHLWHDSFTCVRWHIRTRETTHTHVCPDSSVHITRHTRTFDDAFTCVTRLIHTCGMWHDLFTHVPWLVHKSDSYFAREPYKRDYILQNRPVILTCMHDDVWHSFFQVSRAKEPYKRDYILQKRPIILTCMDDDVWHSSFQVLRANVSRHTCECVMSYTWMTWRSHVWHDACTRVAWLILKCGTTHSLVWPDSFIHMTFPISSLAYECVTHMNALCHTHSAFMCVTHSHANAWRAWMLWRA